MQEIMNGLLQTLITAAGTVLAASVSYGVVVLVSYINKKRDQALVEINKIKDEQSRQLSQNVLEDVTKALTTAAKSMEESMVPVLKSTTEDGKLTKEDQEVVFNAAKELANKIMGENTKDLLADIVDDTETYINAKLQEVLNNMKASGNNISSTQKIDTNLNS